jgi:hypothetical protein
LHPDGRVSVPVDLQAQAVAGGDKALTGGDGSLALKGKVALTALRFGGLDVTVMLRTPALAALRPLLSPNLPALTNVRFDGRVVVPADAASVAFKNAKLLTREGDVTGDWTLGQQARLTMDGKLVSPRLDMDLMLAAFGVELPPAFGVNTAPAISTAPLPWALLRGPVVSLSTKIEAMTFQGQVAANELQVGGRSPSAEESGTRSLYELIPKMTEHQLLPLMQRFAQMLGSSEGG